MNAITLAIAIAGFAVAVGHLLWRLYAEGYRDRARLKVSMSWGFVTAPLPGFPRPDEYLVMIEAANVGRRPVTITSGGLECPGGRSAVFTGDPRRPLPARLNEGENVTLMAIEARLYEGLTEDGLPAPTHIAFKDAAGKTHRAKIPKKARQQLAEGLANAVASASTQQEGVSDD